LAQVSRSEVPPARRRRCPFFATAMPPTFGRPTIAQIAKQVAENDTKFGEKLDLTGHASCRMKPTDSMRTLAEALKQNTNIKLLVLRNLELADPAMEPIVDLLTVNHTIEEMDLQSNKITSAGAIRLADGLQKNRGLKTLNLLDQAVKPFGGDCVMRYMDVFTDNITLTKWKVDSKTPGPLSKLLARNVEIQRCIAQGKDYSNLLPKAAAGVAAKANSQGAVDGPTTPSTSEATTEQRLASLETVDKAAEAAPATAANEKNGDVADGTIAIAGNEESPVSPEAAPATAANEKNGDVADGTIAIAGNEESPVSPEAAPATAANEKIGDAADGTIAVAGIEESPVSPEASAEVSADCGAAGADGTPLKADATLSEAEAKHGEAGGA